MDNFDLTIIGIGFLTISGANIFLYIQLIIFGKRLKKIEEQLNIKNN